MNKQQNWYIIQQEDGTCDIITSEEKSPNVKSWGEFKTQEEAIVKRVGLIRSGKCQPQ
ncbi:conserved hypothetical protein [Hyella patelloides LEGE 07179]|uniref:DDE transposase family protein n=1 Tax=Hyella patelloides LEGE 07179 TaxID=945734 RepID=A0A563VU53_9CYAN|nr:hypothetical protein [Hyella patelloides]VEP15002.1 conserved hypothetical protein [Hyella patelloides LEGE 07179]